VDNLGRAWPNDEMVTPSADTQVTVRPSAGKVPAGSLAPFSNFRFEGTAQIVMKSDSVVRCSSDEGFLGSLEITSETMVTPVPAEKVPVGTLSRGSKFRYQASDCEVLSHGNYAIYYSTGTGYGNILKETLVTPLT